MAQSIGSLANIYIRPNDNLPVYSIDIPLEHYTVSDEVKSSFDPEDKFKRQVTVVGGFLEIDNVVHKLNYRIHQSLDSFELVPITLNQTITNYDFQALRFQLPQDITIQEKCFSIQYGGGDILVDFLSSKNTIVSLNISLQNFIKDKSELTSLNFHTWGFISAPYSFEVRNPFLLRPLTENELILSLKDGGLLQLSRSKELKTFHVTIFNDTSYLDSLKLKLFRRGKFWNENLSPKAIISILPLTETYLATLSIDKILRIWNLNTRGAVLERSLSNELPDSLAKDYLDSSVANLLQKKIFGNTVYLSVSLPLSENIIILYSVTLSDDIVSLSNLENHEILPIKPDTGNLWLLQDYAFLITGATSAKFWFLWRSNSFSVIHQYDFSLDNGELSIKSALDLTTPKSSIKEDFNGKVDQIDAHYVTRIFNLYDLAIISTVYEIFERLYYVDNFVFEKELAKSSTYSLKDRIVNLLHSHLTNKDNNLYDLGSQWVKFETTCKELWDTNNESLSINLDLENNLLYVLNGLNYSIVRDATIFELILSANPITSPQNITKTSIEDLNQLSTLLSDYSSSFPQSVLSEVAEKLLTILENERNKTTLVMNELFQKYLQSYISKQQITELLSGLSSIEHVIESVEFLISYPESSYHFEEDSESSVSRRTEWGEEILFREFQSRALVHKVVFLNLILVMITVDNSNEIIVTLFEKLLKSFKHNQLVLEAMKRTSEKPPIFASIFNFLFPKPHNINGNSIASLFSRLLKEVADGSFIKATVSHLLNQNDYMLLGPELMVHLQKATPVDVFLRAMVAIDVKPEDAKEIFQRNDTLISKHTLTQHESWLLNPIERLTVLFNVSLTEYYNHLTEFFSTRKLHSIALSMALRAIESSAPGEDDHIQQWNCFTLALSVENYELAYSATQNLKPEFRRNALKQFILTLMKNGLLIKFINYDFTGSLELINEVLQEFIDTTPNLEATLKFHKLAYSWRLKVGDYRGACESLYQFIDKQRSRETRMTENESIVLVEFYLIIINLLFTFSNTDDRWILAKQKAGNKILTLPSLQEEYQDLISSIS
ncbi:hypothetical protein LJB42_000872 [Komagataella kurtzmanii]|nr:hypothetical protein LJB42_000872 [Komagataella kurtzmanii]